MGGGVWSCGVTADGRGRSESSRGRPAVRVMCVTACGAKSPPPPSSLGGIRTNFTQHFLCVHHRTLSTSAAGRCEEALDESAAPPPAHE